VLLQGERYGEDAGHGQEHGDGDYGRATRRTPHVTNATARKTKAMGKTPF